MSFFLTSRNYSIFIFFSLFLFNLNVFGAPRKLSVVWNSQTQYSDIASSSNRVCAIAKQDGSLNCWTLFSKNDFSGLPQNEVVYNSEKFISLAVADTHVCALSVDYNWYCVGKNENGELGNGTNTNSLTPILVQAPSGVHFKALFLDDQQTCAISDSSDLYCWGDVRQSDFTLVSINTPTLVNSNIKWKSISLGGDSALNNDFMCGISTDNKAYCKGNNVSGELGNGTIYSSTEFIEVNVPNNNFKTLSAGDAHVCGLLNIGDVYCWGDNSYSQLGTPVSELNYSLNPILLNSDLNFADMSAKSKSTCLKTTSGKEYCFGDDTYGQLNVAPTQTENSQIITDAFQNISVIVNHPAQLSTLSFYKVVEGRGNTCGLVDDSINKVSSNSRDYTLQCYGFLDKNKYAQISIGFENGCGISQAGSRLLCWDNNKINAEGSFSTPWNSGFQIPWSSTEQYDSVAESANYGCAIRTSDKQIACFSKLENVSIPGLLKSIQKNIPQLMPFSASDLFSNQFKKVALNEDHICALQTDGLVFCWGNNNDGQLGNNSSDNSATPVQVVDENGNGLSFLDIAVGKLHSCGVTTDKNIYCWGDNTFLQLGNSSVPLSSVALKVDETSISNNQFNSIVSDKNATCAINTLGKIICFGEDKNGIFLNDEKNNLISKLESPIFISTNIIAQEISLKNGTLCALDTSSHVSCWGSNENGKINGNANQNSLLDPFLETDNLFNSVSVGDNKVCAIRQANQSSQTSTPILFDKQLTCFHSDK